MGIKLIDMTIATMDSWVSPEWAHTSSYEPQLLMILDPYGNSKNNNL